jgi:hypothetical protein
MTCNKTNHQLYRVTQHFTGGLLVGIDYSYISNRQMDIGWECKKPYGNTSPYIITDCQPVFLVQITNLKGKDANAK